LDWCAVDFCTRPAVLIARNVLGQAFAAKLVNGDA
jgi:hypothetical protein